MKDKQGGGMPAAPTFGIRKLPGGPGGDLRLGLSGPLDAEGAPALRDELETILEKGVRHVELDFGGVTFLSSMGIGSLIAAIGEYRDLGGDVVLVGLSAELLEIFRILDLLDYVTIR